MDIPGRNIFTRLLRRIDNEHPYRRKSNVGNRLRKGTFRRGLERETGTKDEMQSDVTGYLPPLLLFWKEGRRNHGDGWTGSRPLRSVLMRSPYPSFLHRHSSHDEWMRTRCELGRAVRSVQNPEDTFDTIRRRICVSEGWSTTTSPSTPGQMLSTVLNNTLLF